MKFPHAPLLLSPSFSPRPWGGILLRDRLGKDVPEGETIGESWELSDHPNGRSTIAEGRFKGKTFGEVIAEHPREMIGSQDAPERYPLLVKFIDAAEDLSIQVHPSDATAPEGDRGKTECWYVMDCDPDTEVIFGLLAETTPEQLRDGAKTGELEKMVARHPLHPGDFLFVRAGTVHAILGGTLICEIQQSSDTTYRLWDWNRKPERELHVDESLRVIDWEAAAPDIIKVAQPGKLAQPLDLTDNEYFRVRVFDVPEEEPLTPPVDTRSGLIVVCVAGKCKIFGEEREIDLETGRTAFIPACIADGDFAIASDEAPARVLVAESREL